MPPKRFGTKGRKSPKAKKPRDPNAPKPKKLKKVIDGLKPSEMTPGQLLGFIKRMQAEQGREQLERNLFMLEKTKLMEQWMLLLDLNKQLFNESQRSLVEMQKAEGEKAEEERAQNHILRHMQAEELRNLAQVRLKHLAVARQVSDDLWEIGHILGESAFYQRQRIRQMLEKQFTILRAFHSSHFRKIQGMLVQLSNAMFSKEREWERKFVNRQENQVATINEKTSHISQLKMDLLDYMDRNHEKILLELQTYFNDMTANNFVVMSSLQAEVETARTVNSRLKRNLAESKAKYEEIINPLLEMQANFARWTTDDTNFEHVWAEAQRTHRMSLELAQKSELTEYMNETLLQQIEIIEKERDKLKQAMAKMVLKQQRLIGMQDFVHRIKSNAAKKDAQFLNNMHGTWAGNPHLLNGQWRMSEKKIQALKRAALEYQQCTAGVGDNANAVDGPCYRGWKNVYSGKTNLQDVISRPRSATKEAAFPVPKVLGDGIDFLGAGQQTRTMLRPCGDATAIRPDYICRPLPFDLCYYKKPKEFIDVCHRGSRLSKEVGKDSEADEGEDLSSQEGDESLYDCKWMSVSNRNVDHSNFLASLRKDDIDKIVSKRADVGA